MKYLIFIALVFCGYATVESGIVPASNELFSTFNTLATLLIVVGIFIIYHPNKAIHYTGISIFAFGTGMRAGSFLILNNDTTDTVILLIFSVLLFGFLNWVRDTMIQKK
ncbi:MAG: hypothetical protein ACI9TY_000751 [Alphaproteobacteria bacterium]|jgi:hypothetical protein